MGGRDVRGIVLEDRGPIGVNARRLYRIRVPMGPRFVDLELPLDALHALDTDPRRNDVVWALLARTDLLVELELGGMRFVGQVVGPGESVVSDAQGNAVPTVVLSSQTGGVTELPSSSRVLRYGASTWRNLLFWHVVDAAEKTLVEAGGSVDGHLRSAKQNILIGDDRSVLQYDGLLQRGFSDLTRAQLERLVGRLRARLAPMTDEEQAFVAQALSRATPMSLATARRALTAA